MWRGPLRGVLCAMVAGLLLAGCTDAPTPGDGPLGSATTSSALTSTSPTSTAPPPTDSGTVPGGCALPPCYSSPVDNGTIPGAVPEASGLAASSTDPDLFFVVDDASKTSGIVAIRLDGTVVAEIEVDGMAARNAEALVAGVCEAGSGARCLYVGDIGGNDGRSSVVVYRIAEPDAAALPSSVSADAWTFDYPDGEFNAEALLVADDGSVLVITKPDEGIEPHRVYSGPAGGGELTLRSTFVPPTPERSAQSVLVGTVVTDASRLTDRVLLLTYDQAVEYLAPTPGADPATFPDWPFRQLPIPGQWQSEGISYRAAGGCGYVVISEKSPLGGAAIGSVGCE